MTMQTVTIALPERLYAQLQARAAQRQHSLAAEVLEVLATAIPAADALPDDLEQALASLALLDDQALWQAAGSQLAAEAAARLEELHLKQQRTGLNPAETYEEADLVRQYERAMLVRAQATALLHQRGYDVSSLRRS